MVLVTCGRKYQTGLHVWSPLIEYVAFILKWTWLQAFEKPLCNLLKASCFQPAFCHPEHSIHLPQKVQWCSIPTNVLDYVAKGGCLNKITKLSCLIMTNLHLDGLANTPMPPWDAADATGHVSRVVRLAPPSRGRRKRSANRLSARSRKRRDSRVFFFWSFLLKQDCKNIVLYTFNWFSSGICCTYKIRLSISG